ncbi:hypothetical protein VTO42DRAFT_6514 [Malbranchea cinnamomea]
MDAAGSQVSLATTDHETAVGLPDLSIGAPNQGIEALKDIVYGSTAGIAGKFIEYPFDTVKVRLQSQPDGVPLRYKGPLDCFRQSLQTEGVRGLYRGISAPVVGAAVENSCLFFSYRIAQEIMQKTLYPSASELPFSALLVCGAWSGAVTSVALTPVELIKCKMQVPVVSSNGQQKAPGILALILSVFRNDGILGFWRGQLGTLIRETGGSAAWFGSYEGVSAIFRSYQSPSTKENVLDDSSTRLPIYQRLIAGAAAGINYNFLFFPADTIKSRIQTEDVSNAARGAKRPSFWEVGQTVYRQHGVAGLYRGCGITCARSAPSSAFIFFIYEGLRHYFG